MRVVIFIIIQSLFFAREREDARTRTRVERECVRGALFVVVVVVEIVVIEAGYVFEDGAIREVVAIEFERDGGVAIRVGVAIAIVGNDRDDANVGVFVFVAGGELDSEIVRVFDEVKRAIRFGKVIVFAGFDVKRELNCVQVVPFVTYNASLRYIIIIQSPVSRTRERARRTEA